MRKLVIVISVLLLSACASQQEDLTIDWSPERLFREGKTALNIGENAKAITYFEKIEARYPTSPLAIQSQLELAYGYHKQGESVLASATADRFIRQHPQHPAAAYAYYLKGIAKFPGNLGLFGSMFNNDISDRDQRSARESFVAFTELIERFPESEYSDDAKKRLDFLVQLIASSEIKIAQFYLRKKAYLAATNRAQNVVRDFQSVPVLVEDALSIMIVSYNAMGLQDLMKDSIRVLEVNFPQSRYLKNLPVSFKTAPALEQKLALPAAENTQATTKKQ